jgi:hypothetical protein
LHICFVQLATQIARSTREREVDVERSEQRAIREARRVSSLIARMVRDFWTNVDKVVDSRAQANSPIFSHNPCVLSFLGDD